MKDIISQIDDAEREQALGIPAKRLIEKLKPLRSKEEQTSKRWFWELLQNASDYNNSVSVKLEIAKNRVVFSHDGNPFSIKDVYNLISPDSGKDSDEIKKDNIGKFGSGLVSTHILSSEIFVNGAFTDENRESLYQFEITLDRSRFNSKEKLIEDIQKAKQDFKDGYRLIPQEDYQGYMTSFSYNTSKRLPGMSKDLDVVSEGLKQIYEVLPYTLAFMPKVESIKIHDTRPNASIKEYFIERKKQDKELLIYHIKQDKKSFQRTFVKHTYKEVETTYEINSNRILPLPKGIAKLFCGLPMIGSEINGVPFIINSLSFEPTIEREGVEITVNDKENIAIFKEALELYRRTLQYIAKQHLKDAYHLVKISRRFNGQEGSRNIFGRDFLPEFQSIIEQSIIVENANGEWSPVSQMTLPYNEGKTFDELYEVARETNYHHFPSQDTYEGWVENLDFTIFKHQKYTLAQFAEDISELDQVQTIHLHFSDNVKEWLHRVISLIVAEDEQLLRKYHLFPNQKGALKSITDIHVDNQLPAELKSIYNQLYPEEIEHILLDPFFNDFKDIINKGYTLTHLTHEIDNALKEKYISANASTLSFALPLNDIYTWINTEDKSKDELEKLFPWFYPMRATLFMDSFGDAERDYAFSIVQSGKIKSLAQLANSILSAEELEYLGEYPKMLREFIAMRQEISDTKYADSQTGEFGEELVYKDLCKKYPKRKGYEIIWSSQLGEPCFDFEIKLQNQTIMYVDAKTTNRGIDNCDSIPFFMRRSQWEFLPTIDNSIKYIIARVFKKGNSIHYLQISMK